MSIAYLDPGNIESDLQAGAVAQYRVCNGYKTINNSLWRELKYFKEILYTNLTFDL